MKTWGTIHLIGAALLSLAGSLESQTSVRDVHHVRWPLIDLVMAPDSAWGVLLLAAPNTGAVNWEKSSLMIQLRLEPVYALQWAMRARELLRDDSAAARSKATRVAPALKSRDGGKFLLLGRREKGPAKERFVMVVSDPQSKTTWKTFAGLPQADTLLAALEHAGELAWAVARVQDSAQSDSSDKLDKNVEVISQPAPRYPPELADRGRQGRVWMMFVVGRDGQAEPGSFQPLLSDDSLFTQSAIEALSRSRFPPAECAGKPVRQRVFQVIRFLRQP